MRIFSSIILCLILSCSRPQNGKGLFNDKSQIQFNRDSGFLTKKTGLGFLISNALTDTLESFWNQAKDGDTIAKYYRIKKNGHIYLCAIDLSKKYTFETHLLIELDERGQKMIIAERFFHGNYACCWDNYFNGFNKIGEFFSLSICGTGLGYCCNYLYIFKKILPQKIQNPIPLEIWSSNGENGQSQSFASTLHISGNELKCSSTIETGDIIDDTLKVNKTEKVVFNYTYKDNKWVTKDSAKLSKLNIWL